ncbi:MAG TPA: hypothetical protein VGJ44_25170 [Kribbellaceae bacterium]
MLSAYEAAEGLDSRVFVEVGSYERMLLAENQRMGRILGDRATYREYRGGHDYACWRGGLAAGLIALLG